MSQSNSEVITGLYTAFGRGDVSHILATVDESVEMHSPETLPHGGSFSGRDGAARFFQGIGEHWDGLTVQLEQLVDGGDRIVAIISAHGRLREAGEEVEYSSAHLWTLRGQTPVSFDEYVDAPIGLPAARAAAR